MTPGFEPFTGKRNAINTEVEIDERKATDKLSHTIFFFSKKDLKKKKMAKKRTFILLVQMRFNTYKLKTKKQAK